MAMSAEVAVKSMCGDSITVELFGGVVMERPMTDREIQMHKFLQRFSSKDTHYVWHQFMAEVLESGTTGFELLELADAFAEKHPDWVFVSGVDDDYFTCASVVFVRHGTGDNYMGTSMVCIPQNAPGGHMSMFLYPGHAESLLEGLRHTTQLQLPEPKPFDIESYVKDEQDKHDRKPSSFDFFQNKWETKPWYADMGFVAPEPELQLRNGMPVVLKLQDGTKIEGEVNNVEFSSQVANKVCAAGYEDFDTFALCVSDVVQIAPDITGAKVLNSNGEQLMHLHTLTEAVLSQDVELHPFWAKDKKEGALILVFEQPKLSETGHEKP